MPHPPHPVPLIFSMLSLCISHSQSLDSHFTRLHMPHPLHPVSLIFPCFHSASPIHIRYVCTSLTRHCTCEVPGCGCDCPLHCLCLHHQHVSLSRLFSLPSPYRSHSQSLDSLSLQPVCICPVTSIRYLVSLHSICSFHSQSLRLYFTCPPIHMRGDRL